MFSIGEFSRIARVTAKQLRHYEKLGLLKPEWIDPETGYRYYTGVQLPRLNRILVLKELGLSLDQVRHLLDENISAQEIQGMLRMKKVQLEQTVRDELARILNIEDRLHHIEDSGVFDDTDVVLKAVPVQHFLSFRQIMPSVAEAFSLMRELHRQLPSRVSKGTLGNFAVVFHSDSFDTENVDVEMGFLLTHERADSFALSEGRVLTLRTVPAVETMATMVCVGLAHHVSSYGALGTWIEKNDFQLAGPSWEIFIEPFQPGREEEAVIEVQLPVTKTTNALELPHLIKP